MSRGFLKISTIGIIKSPKSGTDLTLSIDLRLQHIAHRALERAIIENKASSGSVILVDAPRGEILAIANYPSYDNNETFSLNPDSMRNRAIIDMYEPGSSIKPFILARAIDSGLYDLASLIDTSPVKIGSRTIRDTRELGEVDLATVLMRSSNAGMSRIGLSLESDTLWEMMSDFGFGSYVTDGFPGESRGRLHHHTEWGEIGKATMSYGPQRKPLLTAIVLEESQEQHGKPQELVDIAQTDIDQYLLELHLLMIRD